MWGRAEVSTSATTIAANTTKRVPPRSVMARSIEVVASDAFDAPQVATPRSLRASPVFARTIHSKRPTTAPPTTTAPMLSVSNKPVANCGSTRANESLQRRMSTYLAPNDGGSRARGCGIERGNMQDRDRHDRAGDERGDEKNDEYHSTHVCQRVKSEKHLL